MIVLAIIGWILLMVVCVYFCMTGSALLLMGIIMGDKECGIIGAIILACAITGVYNASHISPFTVSVDTHIYQEHK